MPTDTTVDTLTDDRLELGEGVRALDGRLVLVDILSGRLLGHPGPGAGAPGGRLQVLHDLDHPLGAVAPVQGSPGTWVAAVGDGVALLGPGGGLRWLGRPESRHGGATRMNDGVCDAEGRFWAGSMAYDGESPLGSLYRTDHDGSVVPVLDGLAIANGPAVSADGRALFLADSPLRTITRYDLAPDGSLGGARVVVRCEGDGVPDGMTTDAEGTLWVAMHGAGEVRRYSADGELLLQVPVPASQPTSVAVVPGGLVVTSARENLPQPGPSDGALLHVRVVDLAPPSTPLPVRPFVLAAATGGAAG